MGMGVSVMAMVVMVSVSMTASTERRIRLVGSYKEKRQWWLSVAEGDVEDRWPTVSGVSMGSAEAIEWSITPAKEMGGSFMAVVTV